MTIIFNDENLFRVPYNNECNSDDVFSNEYEWNYWIGNVSVIVLISWIRIMNMIIN
jgi:hypothetical protein